MSDQPENKEVTDILRQHGWSIDSAGTEESQESGASQAPEATEEERTIQLDEETLSKLKPPEKERVRSMPGGVFEPTETDPKVKIDPWSRTNDKIGKVTVDSQELEEYTRSLLYDERFQLQIPLLMGKTPLVVTLRSLYVAEREIISMALSKVIESYPIPTLQNAALVADYYLKMALACQVVAIDEKGQDPYDARPEPGMLPESSPKVAELAQLVRIKYGQMHQAKFQLLVRALHIFETKQKILEDAYANRDFPPPADAS